jgi:hypothetical protein
MEPLPPACGSTPPTLGKKTSGVTATDKAGNGSTKTITYPVISR